LAQEKQENLNKKADEDRLRILKTKEYAEKQRKLNKAKLSKDANITVLYEQSLPQVRVIKEEEHKMPPIQEESEASQSVHEV